MRVQVYLRIETTPNDIIELISLLGIEITDDSFSRSLAGDHSNGDRQRGDERDERPRPHGYPADRLHLGPEFAPRVERLQSERLPVLQQHTRGHRLQMRRAPRRILRKRAAQMPGEEEDEEERMYS